MYTSTVLTPVNSKDFEARNIDTHVPRKNAELITYYNNGFFKQNFSTISSNMQLASFAIKVPDGVNPHEYRKVYKEEVDKVIKDQEFDILASIEKKSLTLFSTSMYETLSTLKTASENPEFPILHAHENDLFWILLSNSHYIINAGAVDRFNVGFQHPLIGNTNKPVIFKKLQS